MPWRVRRGLAFEVVPLSPSPGDPFQLLLDSLGIVNVLSQLSPAPGIAPAPEPL